MRRIIRLIVFAGLVGCSSTTSTDSTNSDTSYLGAYTLISVNSLSLPAVVAQTASEKDEIISGTASLNADATFSAVLTFRQTIGVIATTIPSPTTGTYTHSNNSFALKDSGGGITNGTYGNHQLTVVVTGISGLPPLNLVFQHN